MIILLPNTSTQTVSFNPRTMSATGQVNIKLRKDGYNIEETIEDVTVEFQTYFFDVNVAFTILTEGDTYTIEITDGGNLWFRGKVFATSQIDFTVKHVISPNSYTQYDTDSNTTYTVI